MRKVIAGIAIALSLSLTACGAPEVTAGTVVDTSFKEAWVEDVEITEEECTSEWETKTTRVNGKTKTKRVLDEDCEQVGTGEYEQVEHDAQYTLTLEDEEENTGTVSVDEETFNSVEVGDFYDSEASQ